MRRRKRTPVCSSEPKLRHNVYVVLLSKAALKDLSVMRRNPARDSAQPAVYVGMTGLPVDHRFENHKNAYKSARLVRKYGVRLLPQMLRASEPDAVRTCRSNGRGPGRRLTRPRLRRGGRYLRKSGFGGTRRGKSSLLLEGGRWKAGARSRVGN